LKNKPSVTIELSDGLILDDLNTQELLETLREESGVDQMELGWEINSESGEYYDCLNPYKNVSSPSDCLSIVIPDSDGYKCCSMKISYQNKTSYNCFPLESNYSENKEILEKYMTKRSLSPYFSILGGQMEIECGGDIKFIKEYEAFSDEFNICYNGHIIGANDEYSCIENNISIYERKCCFVESSKINNNTTIDDKRCYMIKEEYFNGQKKS